MLVCCRLFAPARGDNAAMSTGEAHATPAFLRFGGHAGNALEVDRPGPAFNRAGPAIRRGRMPQPALELLKQLIVFQIQKHRRGSAFDPDFVAYHEKNSSDSW